MEDQSALKQGSANMDRPIDSPRWGRKRLTWIILAALVLGVFAYLLPALRRWSAAETSVSMSRLRVGTVTRGDLIRDVSAQGSIVAAFSPTLTSSARGTARVGVNPGEVVERGRILVRIASPEVDSRLG